MKRFATWFLCLLLLAIPAYAAGNSSLGLAILCETEDGQYTYIDYGAEIPAGYTPLSILCIETDIQLYCTINDLDWVCQSDGTYGQLYIFDPENTENMISISSQPRPSGEPAQLAAEQWSWYTKSVERSGFSIESNDPLEMTVGSSAHPGLYYEAVLSGEGVNQPLILVFWYTQTRAYTCSVTFTRQEEEHVTDILLHLLSSFQNPAEDMGLEPAPAEESVSPNTIIVICQSEDGTSEFIPYGENAPEGTTPVGLIYTDPAVAIATVVFDPDWIIDPDYENYQVYFFDPEDTGNYITITSYSYPEGSSAADSAALADELWGMYRDSAANVGVTLSEPTATRQQIGLGADVSEDMAEIAHLVYDAVRFDATETASGAESSVSVVCIFGDNLLYLCTAHSLPENQAEVNDILTGMLNNFYNPLDR